MKTNDDFEFEKGIKTWFIIVIVANILGTITNLLTEAPMMSVLCTWKAIIYILLYKKRKRIFFYIIIAVNTTMAILSLLISGSIIFGIGKLIAPTITYLLLRKYWDNMK
jgi:hypothetical protein